MCEGRLFEHFGFCGGALRELPLCSGLSRLFLREGACWPVGARAWLYSVWPGVRGEARDTPYRLQAHHFFNRAYHMLARTLHFLFSITISLSPGSLESGPWGQDILQPLMSPLTHDRCLHQAVLIIESSLAPIKAFYRRKLWNTKICDGARHYLYYPLLSISPLIIQSLI